MMAGFNSFEFLLLKYLHKKKPLNILEWGPGQSTAVMSRACPDARIYSLENNKHWHKIYTVKFSRKTNVFIRFAEGEKYVKLPEAWRHKKFQLIFVDGLCDLRVDCLKTAYNMLDEDGIVILHDSERKKYEEGVKLFKLIEERDGTRVMRK